LWQDEFSVFTADERYVNRRQFAKFLTLTSLGMFAGNLWILARSAFRSAPAYPRQTIANVDEIPVGGVKTFAYPTPQDPCILVRTGDRSWAAYSQKCTHLSCAVYYAREENRLACPCHQGFFSVADGSVLQGPPQRALPRVALEQVGGDLVAVRMQKEESA
jgi:Rieske Fe-S protein